MGKKDEESQEVYPMSADNNIKLMLISLGGSPAPLIKSLKTYRPEKVIFFASQQSVPLSHEVLTEQDPRPAYEFVITDDPNSLYACYSKALECVDRVRKSGVASHEVLVDYTGGTKVMTAALLLSALGRSFRFNYVGGEVRNKAGLGTVKDGHETMFTEASPWAIFAEEERRQVTALFNCRRFSAVIGIIDSIDRKLPFRVADQFEFIRHLAWGFQLWDQFKHDGALRHLEKGIAALYSFISKYSDTGLDHFRRQTVACRDRLAELIQKTNSLKRPHRLLINDLLNNARRKMADCLYDDAAARIYRALELYGQILFEEAAGCSNSSVSPDLIPPGLRERFVAKYQDPKSRYLKLPLTATFEYLKEKGHEAGIRFFEKIDTIKNIQSSRNHSILAHGLKPVSEKGAQSILDTVSAFVRETDFFDFPQLP